jgi:hypothetical protein
LGTHILLNQKAVYDKEKSPLLFDSLGHFKSLDDEVGFIQSTSKEELAPLLSTRTKVPVLPMEEVKDLKEPEGDEEEVEEEEEEEGGVEEDDEEEESIGAEEEEDNEDESLVGPEELDMEESDDEVVEGATAAPKAGEKDLVGVPLVNEP